MLEHGGDVCSASSTKTAQGRGTGGLGCGSLRCCAAFFACGFRWIVLSHHSRKHSCGYARGTYVCCWPRRGREEQSQGQERGQGVMTHMMLLSCCCLLCDVCFFPPFSPSAQCTATAYPSSRYAWEHAVADAEGVGINTPGETGRPGGGEGRALSRPLMVDVAQLRFLLSASASLHADHDGRPTHSTS